MQQSSTSSDFLRPQVWLAFKKWKYRDPWMNWITALVTRNRIIHVEMVFWIKEPVDSGIPVSEVPNSALDSPRTLVRKQKVVSQIIAENQRRLAIPWNFITICVAPVERGGVPQTFQVTQKRYSSEYTFVHLPTTPAQAHVMFEFLRGQRQKPFNSHGNYYNFLPCRRKLYGCRTVRQSRRRKSWFCSEQCMAALQQIGLFVHLRACTTTPGQLYDLLLSERNDTTVTTRLPPSPYDKIPLKPQDTRVVGDLMTIVISPANQ